MKRLEDKKFSSVDDGEGRGLGSKVNEEGNAIGIRYSTIRPQTVYVVKYPQSRSRF